MSVHLENFPDISFIKDSQNLINDMDLIRNICATILFVRDQKNIRVRQPLAQVTIYNYGASEASLSNIKNNESYQEIIKDEVNVKKIEIITIADQDKNIAELKLVLNFKKIGAKLGSKMKEISNLAKQGKWKKIGKNKIEIANEILEDDDFTIKLVPKDQQSCAALPSNDCLVMLDLNISQDLIQEGLARDLIRTTQQNRKKADLDVSDHIRVLIITQDEEFKEAINNYLNYIKEQTLADELIILSKKPADSVYEFKDDNIIEGIKIGIFFSKI